MSKGAFTVHMHDALPGPQLAREPSGTVLVPAASARRRVSRPCRAWAAFVVRTASLGAISRACTANLKKMNFGNGPKVGKCFCPCFCSGNCKTPCRKKMARKKDRWAGGTRGKCGVLSARRKIAAFDPHFGLFFPGRRARSPLCPRCRTFAKGIRCLAALGAWRHQSTSACRCAQKYACHRLCPGPTPPGPTPAARVGSQTGDCGPGLGLPAGALH